MTAAAAQQAFYIWQPRAVGPHSHLPMRRTRQQQRRRQQQQRQQQQRQQQQRQRQQRQQQQRQQQQRQQQQRQQQQPQQQTDQPTFGSWSRSGPAVVCTIGSSRHEMPRSSSTYAARTGTGRHRLMQLIGSHTS